YLCMVEGYTPDLHPMEPRYPHVQVGFKHDVHLCHGEQKIDIIQSLTCSALYPIPFFWATHVMNYLTADSFCITYSTLSLAGKSLLTPTQLLNHQYPNPLSLHIMAKYTQCGFTFCVHPY
ncbi:hypothetical protein GY45DRAFT_1215168, partial [Cubamyces sp. BRFM 1775]